MELEWCLRGEVDTSTAGAGQGAFLRWWWWWRLGYASLIGKATLALDKIVPTANEADRLGRQILVLGTEAS